MDDGACRLHGELTMRRPLFGALVAVVLPILAGGIVAPALGSLLAPLFQESERQHIYQFPAPRTVPKLFAQALRIPGPGGVAGAPANTIWMSGTTGGSTRSDAGCFGLQFTPTANITAVALGRWIVSGNSGTHQINILSEGVPDVNVGNASLNTVGKTPGAYAYTGAVSISLTSGTTYYGAINENSGDALLDSDPTGSISVTGDATWDGSAYTGINIASCVGIVEFSAGSHQFDGWNMKYTKP